MEQYEREHLAALRGGLAGCCVLLKKNGAFPLESPCMITAIGSGVRHTRKGGTGSGEVNSRYSVTVEQGLKDAGFTLNGAGWLDAYDREFEKAHAAFVKEIKAEARRRHTLAVLLGMGAVMPEPEYDLPLPEGGTAAVYVLSRVCGEGNDRRTVKGDYLLTDTEIRDILALDAACDKFMLVLNTGGPVDLTPVRSVGNILVLSQLGVETGAVLADILLGKAVPSGKLTAAWMSAEDASVLDFGGNEDTRYTEGIHVGGRRLAVLGREPLYPFGFGISWTEFSASPGWVSARGTELRVEVEVTNTGALPGSEAVQLYLSAPAGRLDRAVREPAAFAKTRLLQPGERETVSLCFDLRGHAAFDAAQSCMLLEKGEYRLLLSTDGRHFTPAAAVELTADAPVRRVRPIAGSVDFEDLHAAPVEREPLPKNLPRVVLSAAAIPCEAPDYDAAEEQLPGAEALTDEELCLLNIGHHPKGIGIAGIIGDASSSVCGAAGETAHLPEKYGIPSLVMADGPAGLRLTPEYYRDEKGLHPLSGGGIPESMRDYLPSFLGLLGGTKKLPAGAERLEQYATAIPIGTAIAQSWDIGFAERCGDVVGAEMERFGVSLWLAPALNIQRSALCGRNFEYYSEEPLLSGKMAAAVTRGVQRHPGCGTTIKHFAVNNQEWNRVNSCSMVSERALREVYLRGFEIAVRESQPAAVMTSYNLLNGTHTAEHSGLIRDWLRTECGFRGIVMTDWIIRAASMERKPKYPQTSAPAIAAAGGDVMMPGSSADYRDLLKAVKRGTVSREQLRRNAGRLIALAKHLRGTADK